MSLKMVNNVNNQLVNLARSNEVFVAGSVNEAGTGTVVQVKSDSMTNWVKVATRYICQTQAWFETSSVVVTNLGTNTVWIRATDKSGNSSTQTIHVVNSRTNAVFGYDLDGNQTNNLLGSYTWDAENRLVWVDYGTNGSTRMSFDGIGRLRELAEYGTGASPTNVVRYVWNGWLPWAELDASNKVQRTFTWGLDLSSTVGGAGGIGGLMGMRDYAGAGTNYQVRTDGKGNVTEIRRGSDAVVVATYAYAPFGAVLSNSGSYNQPFRFQTKLSHTRSGLGYWGYRWYDYKTGRWLCRDPLGESGGLILYGYCGGNPLSVIDPLGLAFGDYWDISATRNYYEQVATTSDNGFAITGARLGNILFSVFGVDTAQQTGETYADPCASGKDKVLVSGKLAWQAAGFATLGLKGLGAFGKLGMPKSVYHFTSTARKAEILSAGVIRPGAGLLGYGAYVSGSSSRLVGTLQGAHSTEEAIKVSTEGLNLIRTIVPGSYRTVGAPIILP